MIALIGLALLNPTLAQERISSKSHDNQRQTCGANTPGAE